MTQRIIGGRAIFLLSCALVGATPAIDAGQSQRIAARAADKPARVFLLNAKELKRSRNAIRTGDRNTAAAWAKLQREAGKALEEGPFTIVNKTVIPPSGDKHDYMSQAPYFWPDPKSPNGLPYIRRDGERNPEINKITDHRSLDQLEANVETLALAYYFSGDEKYAAKAVELLRTFFLNSTTRMNPHLQYGQFIPGVNTGRGIGLIETRGLTRVVDAIGLLAGSKSLTADDERGIRDWFARFLQWMQESKNGREEAAAKNNHGTYYDVQVVSFALFLDRRDLAMRVLQAARQKRIATQIEPDGRQPLELARTRAWSYSNGNLDGLMQLATLGERAGVDLWHFQTADGRSIRKALDFLTPIAIGEKKWQYQELGGLRTDSLFPLMRRAAPIYRDKQYQEVMAHVPEADASDRSRLLRPNVTATRQAQR
jgi:Alginate lyase